MHPRLLFVCLRNALPTLLTPTRPARLRPARPGPAARRYRLHGSGATPLDLTLAVENGALVAVAAGAGAASGGAVDLLDLVEQRLGE